MSERNLTLDNYKKQTLFLTATLFCLLFYAFLGKLSSLIPESFPLVSLVNQEQLDLISANHYFIFLQTHILMLVGLTSVFIVEALILGWDNSSIKSISNFSTPSARTDVFYIWLRMSGLSDVLFNLFFLGSGFFLLSKIEHYSLIKLNNYFLEFIFTALGVTFFHYVYHRVIHHKYFWELHKLHHAATEMSIFTASREHPLVISASNILLVIPPALFGASTEVIFTYFGLQGIYNMFIHSRVDLFPSWAKFMITTKDHHIHHSIESEHYLCNYGMVLSIWDRIFGTYYDPKKAGAIEFGIEDKNYAQASYFKEIFFICFRWIKQLASNLRPTNPS